MSYHFLRQVNIPVCSRFLSKLTSRLCWKCGLRIEEVASLFCSRCQKIQSVDHSVTYYQLFDISPQFTLNINELTQRFRRLQSTVHPDKFSSHSQQEQEYSNECSSHLNTAYKTLINPIDRGNYLLKLEKQEQVDEKNSDVNKEFLMEVMELNEILAENPTKEELEKINNDNKLMIRTLNEQITEFFKEKDWKSVKELLIKLKYYTNIDEKIKELTLS